MELTIVELLSQLREKNIILSLDGEKLKLTAPQKVMSDDIITEITRYKDEIINFLRNNKINAVKFPPIITNPEERYIPFPLTDVQQAYWIGRSQDFELGNVATHIYMEFEDSGLNIENFEKAWNKLIDRHDMLRAIVRNDGMQQVLEEVPYYKIRLNDLKDKSKEEEKYSLDGTRDEMSHQVLPADQWPLFDMRVSILRNGVVRVHSSIDLLIADALSWQILFKELTEYYLDTEAKLPELDITFRDCVNAEIAMRETELYKRALDYWMKRVPQIPPAPDMPLAVNPSLVKKPQFVRRQGRIKAEEWGRLQYYAQNEGLTPTTILLAVYSKVLALWSKDRDFTINLTLFNRLPRHGQINDVVGDFTSLTLLQIDGSSNETLSDYLKRLQSRLWQDLDNRYVGGVRVMREIVNAKGGGHGSVMPVVFTSDLANAPEEMFTEVYGISQTPQVWLDHQVLEQNGELVLNWDAVSQIFPDGMLDDMFNIYISVLERLCRDENALNLKINQLIKIPQQQLADRETVNRTNEDFEFLRLDEMLDRICGKQPERIAVATPGRIVTYGEIEQYSRAIAGWLSENGTEPGKLVAVFMEKGWEQIAAVYGILRSGAAYLPIAADLPLERVEYLLKNSEVSLILTQKHTDKRIKWPEGVKNLCIDRLEDIPFIKDISSLKRGSCDELAYVIYTSGSTGEPKGVMIDHRGACNTILDVNRRFSVNENDRVFALSALNFDLSVYDIFGILSAGGTVVMPGSQDLKDPSAWMEFAESQGITVWNTVPSLMEMYVEYLSGINKKLPSSLRMVLLSGDWIPLELPDKIRQLGSENIRIISLGGATEASIWSIYYEIGDLGTSWKSIPYGKPLSNQKFYVLDEDLEHKPLWVAGQLYIGGTGVAKGYFGDAERTKNSFILHPETNEILYKTGDMGRYLPDGNIEFLGRQDNQVKVQGHRIELGEIENAINSHPLVKTSVAAVFGQKTGKKQLAAYIVMNRSHLGELNLQEHSSMDNPYSGLIMDPIERLKFKLSHRAYRSVEEGQLVLALDKDEFSTDISSNFIIRRSYRNFANENIDKKILGSLLSCIRHIKLEGMPLSKSMYASAGSLYPVQVYVYIKPDKSQDITGGSYYYHPGEHSLILISCDAYINPSILPPGNRDIYEKSAFAIFLVGDKNAVEPLYGDWSYEFMVLEAGMISQLLEITGPQYGLGLCQIGNFDFIKIAHWFGLGENHKYIHCLVGGTIKESQKTLEALINDNSDVIEMAEGISEAAPSKENVKQEVKHTVSYEIKEEKHGFDLLDSILAEELKKYLWRKLPEYMVPTVFIRMDSLPLNINGKVERNVLPTPEKFMADSQKTHVLPNTKLEKEVAAVWQEVLGVENIGIHDSFFELGGNSVDIVRIYNILRERLADFIDPDREFQLKDLFKFPSVYDLCLYLEQEEGISLSAEEDSLIESDIILDPSFNFTAAKPYDASQKVQSVFVTGATGFLGAHVVYEILEKTECDIYCLVRAESEKEAKEKLTFNMHRLKLWEDSFNDRIIAVTGDLEKYCFGNEKAFEMLAEKTGIIYHCASWVNFVYPYEALRGANVLGMKEIVRLAGTQKIKPVNYVSSLTVFPLDGNTKDSAYNENYIFNDYKLLLNGYNQSKWAAEKIAEAARERGIPVSIFRPSFICGHSQSGVCNEKDLVWSLVKGCLQLGSYSELGAAQLVPVDYVSSTMVYLSMNADSYGKNYHLIPPEAVRYTFIFEIMRMMGYPIAKQNIIDWQQQAAGIGTDNALSSFIPLFMRLTADGNDSHVGTVYYKNDNTGKGLAGSEIFCPLIDGMLLRNYIDYLSESGFIDKSTIKFNEEAVMSTDMFDGIPYRLWNPFTDMDEFLKYLDFGPSVIVKGEGPYIYNKHGQKYINAASSLWNVAVGHGREEIVQAAAKQMRELSYSSCFRQTHPRAIELASKLVDLTMGHYGNVYLASNGSEAIEAAIKMTRQYFRQSQKESEKGKYKIISVKGSYHGVSLGALSTSGEESDIEKYGPLVPGFLHIKPPYCYRCPYGRSGYPECSMECACELEKVILEERPESCAAFILEPVMGVYGIIPPPVEYYQKVGEICKKYGMLLIADEVTTGFGRTGELFASMSWMYKPDILCVGKGISSGYLPLAATLATPEIYERFRGGNASFSHGSTASGHPVCAAAGLANIDIILREKLVENSKKIGGYLKSRLDEIAQRRDVIGDVRGRGLMIGMELVEDKTLKTPIDTQKIKRIILDCYNMGVFVYIAPNLRTLGLFPPLIIDEKIADDIADALDKAFKTGITAKIGWTSRFIKNVAERGKN
ncbi:MAG: amino acid adenylation domain protein [Eubacterium sp.]|nr:amino acid adenylation domain protein [Eubacterium sp.]